MRRPHEAQAEIERLRLIVQKLQRSQFGRRAERLDDHQMQLGFEDLDADIARVEATLPSEEGQDTTHRSQSDRPSLPAHLPREEVRFDPEHQACPCCGRPSHANVRRVLLARRPILCSGSTFCSRRRPQGHRRVLWRKSSMNASEAVCKSSP